MRKADPTLVVIERAGYLWLALWSDDVERTHALAPSERDAYINGRLIIGAPPVNGSAS